MRISERHNRYYHGALLKEAYDVLGHIDLIYHDPETGEAIRWVDEEGRPMRLVKGIDYGDLEDLKRVLKYFNLDYPRDEKGVPKSTRDISPEELQRHQNYIVQVMIDNGLEYAVRRF